MPFERREILFYLTEIAPSVLSAGELLIGKLPESGDIRIIDALHTGDFHSSFHEIQQRFRSLYDVRGQRNGVMFRAATRGLFKKDQVAGLIVQDRALEQVLLKACKDFNIGLPRAAQKKVVARDLAIGFELIFDTAGLSLEEA